MALTILLESCGRETFGWPQLYETDLDFPTNYQILVANAVVNTFHLQEGLLCRLGHIYIPSREKENMIWESHYSHMGGHFGVENKVAMLQKHFY